MGFSKKQATASRPALPLGMRFVATLVGMAIDHGAKISATTPVLSMFPQHQPFKHLDRNKRAITVGDLMEMSSGLACDDNGTHSPGGEGKMQGQHAERDWHRFTLNLPMAQALSSEIPQKPYALLLNGATMAVINRRGQANAVE